jgi:hypothetical protein
VTSDLKLAGRTLAILGLDYLKWTQLVPMLVAWAFLLLALGMLALVNFQETGFATVEGLVVLWERYPWLPRLDGAVDPTENGGLTLNEEGFREVVVNGWIGISLVLFLLSLARRAAFGPIDPRPFRRKLAWLLLPLALVWLTFAGTYVFGSETFHGPAWHWFVGFTVACGLVFAVSTYSLGVGHVVGLMQEALRSREEGEPAGAIPVTAGGRDDSGRPIPQTE